MRIPRIQTVATVAFAVLLSAASSIAQVIPRPTELSYEVPNDVLKDDGTGSYSAPHWKDTIGQDGIADQEGEIHFPIAYVRSDSVKVASVKFLVPDAWNGLTGSLVGTGPENDRFTDSVTVQAGEILGEDMTSEDALPDSVRFYGPYQILWSVTFRPTPDELEQLGIYTWQDTLTYPVGITNNRLFCMGAKTSPGLYETVGELSCIAANGKSAPNDIRDEIWNNVFSNSNTGPANPKRKQKDGYNAEDAEKLKYYASTTPGTTLALLMASGNGNCQAWSSFFGHSLALHGISNVGQTIKPNPAIQSFHDYMMIQNWGLLVDRRQSNAYLRSGPDAEVRSTTGKEAQNNEDPASFAKEFATHCVNKIGGEIFDPSYGLRTSNLLGWQNLAVWGVGATSTGMIGFCREALADTVVAEATGPGSATTYN